jgi:peptidoglycan/xylan/chitin deacetylase (PgdA/CDA1 family)
MFLLFLLFLLLFAPLFMVYKPPSLLIRYFAYRWPDVLWTVPTNNKIVALTIDDAPSEYTAEILQVLQQNDARATMFVIGAQIAGREEVLRRAVEKGMELGNHAMRDQPSRALRDDELAVQIQSVHSRLAEIYASVDEEEGKGEKDRRSPPKYFRPGSGFFSERMRRLVATLGYRLVLGSVYPHDPQIPYAWLNARHVLSMVKPGGIIICHDRRGWTVPMLKKVLPELKRRGYKVVTVTELLEEASK